MTPARSRRRAILLVLGSSGAFAVAAALVKVAAPAIPVFEIMLFRSAVSCFFLWTFAARTGGWSVLRTRRPLGHAVRSGAGLGGMFGAYYGYAHLPLAAATALGFAMPIILALLGTWVLRERLTAARAGSIGAGLFGVLLVVRPWKGAGGLPLLDTAIVLAGVVAWAVSMASIRRMGQTGERNITIVAWFSIVCTALSAILAAPVWITPAPLMWAVLVAVGAVSSGAQLLMTEGYRSGEAGMLAPFEYSAIFYTVTLGWLAWGEVPGPWEAAGFVVLVVSGLFTWWRETRGSD